MGFFINMKIEVWKAIEGYDNMYFVSSFGRVKSVFFNKEKILKQVKHPLGYLKVNLYKNKKMKTHFVHQVVASMFVENKKNNREVNHKDGVKTNNSVENLEWSTTQENIKHAHRIGLCDKQRKSSSERVKKNKIVSKEVLDLETGIFYPSLSKGCYATNINKDTESYRIRTKNKNRFIYTNN